MKRSDVDSLVCATDAGREGELILRLVYHQAKCRNPFKRLWISTMEDEDIREDFRKPRTGTEYDSLYETALCRERADRIVGMNATWFFSCLYGTTLNVSRVMTPTLGMAVMREAEIMGFKAEPFFTTRLKTSGFVVTSERFKDQAAAKTALDYTRSLYENKLVTYSRTDSSFLTNDMQPIIPALLHLVAVTHDQMDRQVFLKLLLFPVFIVTMTLTIILNVLLHLGSFAAGLGLLVMVCCIISRLQLHEWNQAIPATGMTAVPIGAFFGAGMIVALFEEANTRLGGFIRNA